jgi:hypothetical protein
VERQGSCPSGSRPARAPTCAAAEQGLPAGPLETIARVLAYVSAHGGGTIAVSSQSSAAAAIIAEHADVAGIGGFSGRESDVSISWLSQEVGRGKIRWVLAEPTVSIGGAPGDSRVGAKPAMRAVRLACLSVAMPSSAGGAAGAGRAVSSSLYDCRGRAGALMASGGMSSS